MKLLKYSEWKGTAQTLHMILQMMGKVKLSLMPAQPEWGHILLYPTARGFTTGLIYDGKRNFDIGLNLTTSMVTAYCTDGATAGFPLRNNTSVSEYFAEFQRVLDIISCNTEFSTIPQEVSFDTPFEKQAEKRNYDEKSALLYFGNSLFAYHTLLRFVSPYRGKKLLPGLFWGTFDISAVLFSGVEKPYPGSDMVGKVAFDEQFVEFGYWPGDENVDEPHFFALPYPFLEKELGSEGVSPKEAFFSMEKKEFFLPLSAALRRTNPASVVQKFLSDAFGAVAQAEDWKNMEWFTKPLLV